MKKFTLLATLALCAGSMYAQDVVNGLKLSDEKAGTYYYYRIRNMRAMRLDYTNGTLRNMEGDSVNTDRGGYYQSAFQADGITPTPKIADRPYMGLSNLGGNWWLSFANDEGFDFEPFQSVDANGIKNGIKEIKNPDTEFWYFVSGGRAYPGTVMIKNAVIKGSVATTAKTARDAVGYNRSNMDFNTNTTNRYYVLPVKPAFEATQDTVDWCEAILQHLSPEDFEAAFAFSLKDTIANDADHRNQCLDMNNYVNIKIYAPQFDENGDTVRNDNGNIVYNRYGFAGVDRTWSPVTTTSNKNHWENNGSIFFVNEADAKEAEAAKTRYAEVIAQGFKDGAMENAKLLFSNNITAIEGWLKVPAIWAPEVQGQLRAIQQFCQNWNGEGADLSVVNDPESRDAYIAAVQKIADQKLAEAASLAGEGCQIRLQNQLALRDLNKFVNEGETVDPDLQLGNAFLCAGGSIYYRQGSEPVYCDNDPTFEDYYGMGVVPVLEENYVKEDAVWELKHVAGTAYFLLYNEANDCYIRKHHDMYTFLGGDEYLGDANSISEYGWATTDNIDDACPFTFQACPNEEGQYQPNEDELELIGAAGLELDVENKVRLHAEYKYYTFNPGTQKYDEQSFSGNIHRGSAGSDYNFVDWGPTSNNWYADTNAFRVYPEKQGGINEVAASKVKANGIYDLQGRRVNKAGKGIYIVDGVKIFNR